MVSKMASKPHTFSLYALLVWFGIGGNDLPFFGTNAKLGRVWQNEMRSVLKYDIDSCSHALVLE